MGLAIFWKTIIANPVSVSRAGYILANIFEHIASFVSFLDSRDIFIGELKKKIADFYLRRGPSFNRGSAIVQNYRQISFSRIRHY